MHSGEIDVAAGHDGLPERIDEKLGWLREGAGHRFDDLEINAWLAFAEVTDDAAALGEGVAALFETDVESLLSSPLVLIGSQSEIEERLQERRPLGLLVPRDPGREGRDFAPLSPPSPGRSRATEVAGRTS